VRDVDEVCDDGNTVSGDGCSADCRDLETCGNGQRDPGEVCDDGNRISGDGCSADCLSAETCPNDYVDAVNGELCDEGGNTATCNSNCTLPDCGDGHVNPMYI